jgi:hypothetical protein
VEPERPWSLESSVAELRANVGHLQTDVAELRTDIRRLDGRVFQLLLIQIATLATALGSLVTALVTGLD